MSAKPPYKFIDLGRGKNQRGVTILGVVSALLIVGGLYFSYRWISLGGLGAIPIFASDTPTATQTLTPSNTPQASLTASITPTPTVEASQTASAPFLYTVQLDDTLSGIADQFGVDFIIIMSLNGMNNESVLFIGQDLIIPDPNTGLPDPTALPGGLARGAEIDYLVLPGDTLAIIAEQFLSTEDAIIEANELDNPNEIFVGQLLKVPVRLITATPGPSPTATISSGGPFETATEVPSTSETTSSATATP
jgi:LysM repeat protein